MPKTPTKLLIETVEIAKFVTKLAPKKVLSDFGKSVSREASIFRLIVESETQLSDDDIILALGIDARRCQQSLWKLKAMLLEHVFEFDLKRANYSDYAQRLHALDLSNARVHILEWLGAAYSANAEANFWLKEATVLEQWDLALMLLSPLLNWATLSGDQTEYDRLCAEQRRFRLLDAALADAREATERTRIVFAKSGAEHPEVRPRIDLAIARLTPIAREHGTFSLQDALLRLRRMAQQVTMDYAEALAICDGTDTLLEEYPLFANRARRSRNALTRLMCYIQTGQTDLAEAAIARSLDLFDPEDQDWYGFQEWHFILLMHTEQFEEAHALVQNVMGRSRFASQTGTTRDRWHLFQIYAALFTARPVPGEKKPKEEKTGELLRHLMQQFPSFKGDYAGYGMAAVALEILIVLWRRGDEEYFFERIESLAKYKTRHLKRGHETQSNHFIAMMQLLETKNLDVEKIKKAAAPILKRMVAIKTIDKYQAQQVLRYEMLWAKTVELLPAYVAWLRGTGWKHEKKKAVRRKTVARRKTIARRKTRAKRS